MSFYNYIAKQFANPKGIGGNFISFIMNHQNRMLYTETIRLLSVTDSDRILDVGCGNGYTLNILAREYDAKLAGIDTSAGIIKAASRRNRQFLLNGKMSLHCGNVSSMAFAPQSFSKAYTINTVYFWQDLNKSMLEIRRILKPGGVFISTLYSNETLTQFSHTRFEYKLYDEQQLTSAGTYAGFSTKIVPLLDGAAFSYIYQKIK